MSERNIPYHVKQLPRQPGDNAPDPADYVAPDEMDRVCDQMIRELEALKAEYRRLYEALGT